jgi:hypothetical protein
MADEMRDDVSDEEKRELASRGWAEGNKYAIEGGRSLFLLNGAAAAGLLTFIGSHPPSSFQIFRAIYMFAAGSLFAAVFFVAAYMAQLTYGNALIKADENLHREGLRWQFSAFVLAAISLVLFLLGVYTAGHGLSR